MRETVISFRVELPDQEFEATTRICRASAWTLSVHTVIPEPPLAFELHSTFVGHPATATHATHLALGPRGVPTTIGHKTHAVGALRLDLDLIACVYEHLMQLQDRLHNCGHASRLHVPQLTLQTLRV